MYSLIHLDPDKSYYLAWHGGVNSQFLLVCGTLLIIVIKQIKHNTVTITTEDFQTNTTQSHVYQI